MFYRDLTPVADFQPYSCRTDEGQISHRNAYYTTAAHVNLLESEDILS
jgi:hypothetical protein